MGLGDGKLLALIGAVLGWKALPIVIFSGSFLGALISIPLVVVARRRSGGTPTPAEDADADAAEPSLARVQVPFGPFLAMGAVIDLFFGPAILRLLLGGFSDGS